MRRHSQNVAMDADGKHESKWPREATTTNTGRVWSSHGDADAGEAVLLPSRAPRENKYHRPGAPGSLLPACGTFDTTGVVDDRVDVRERGYRPCRLCWPDTDGEGGDVS